MSQSADIVVIGGGVIGLSCAYFLAKEQLAVTVLDSQHRGQASFAAAGMLAPLAESGKPGPFVEMSTASLRRWPLFAEEICSESKAALRIYGHGMLRLACTEAEEASLIHALAWQEALGLPLHWLDAREVHEKESEITRDARGAIYSPEERLVEPRVLLQALTEACLRKGVTMVSGAAVTRFEESGFSIGKVWTSADCYNADHVLITGGAWSSQISSLLHVPLAVSPVRGQILTLGPASPAPFSHTIYFGGGYLVPRPDGRIIAGATEEHAGFEVKNTAAGVASQLQMGMELVPCLSSVPIESITVGLRPVSEDGLPLIGALPGWKNVMIAGGHGRNGILLTPITGKWVADYLAHGRPIPSAFNPARFLEERTCLSS